MKSKKNIQNKCPNCGGDLVFNPSGSNLVCQKCTSKIAIKSEYNFQKHDFFGSNKHNKVNGQNNKTQCPNCGSQIVLKAHQFSGVCQYCSTSVVVDNLQLMTETPDAVIPFAFDKGQASGVFAMQVKKNFWAPRRFKKQLPESKIEGDYIPSFAFNADVNCTYSGMLYKNVTRKKSDGSTTTERKYFPISGRYAGTYNNVLVEASSKIAQQHLTGVLPFDYKGLKKYNDDFISGYVVENYNETVSDCYAKYNSILDSLVRADILKKYTYDGVSSFKCNKSLQNQTYSYYIVPVYKFEYKYKNKVFETYMNGQTGQIDRNIPKSGLKIALTILIPLLIFFLPFVVAFVKFLLTGDFSLD